LDADVMGHLQVGGVGYITEKFQLPDTGLGKSNWMQMLWVRQTGGGFLYIKVLKQASLSYLTLDLGSPSWMQM
jgi:hypothetical protein